MITQLNIVQPKLAMWIEGLQNFLTKNSSPNLYENGYSGNNCGGVSCEVTRIINSYIAITKALNQGSTDISDVQENGDYSIDQALRITTSIIDDEVFLREEPVKRMIATAYRLGENQREVVSIDLDFLITVLMLNIESYIKIITNRYVLYGKEERLPGEWIDFI